MLNIRASNIVEEHKKQVVISYKFAQSRMLVEPLMLIISFFLFFIICSIIARLDSPKEPKEGSKTAL